MDVYAPERVGPVPEGRPRRTAAVEISPALAARYWSAMMSALGLGVGLVLGMGVLAFLVAGVLFLVNTVAFGVYVRRQRAREPRSGSPVEPEE